jgi:hypothetical protein
MRAAAVALCALLAGCAAPQKLTLYKDGGSQQEYEADIAKCEYEVSLHTQQVDPTMRSSFGQELDRSMRRRDLGIKCMLARGYRLQR